MGEFMQPDIQQLFGLILLKNPFTNSLDLYDAPEIFLEGVFQSPRQTWA